MVLKSLKYVISFMHVFFVCLQIFDYVLNFFLFIYCVVVHSTCGGQGTTFGSWLSPSTMCQPIA